MAQSFTKGIPISTDGTMAANSDGLVSSQKAIVTYVTANAGGSGWVFLDSATASSSATLDFTSSIDSTYYMYAFVLENIVPASNSTLYIRTSTDAGSSWDSGASDYSFAYVGYSGSVSGSGGGAESQISTGQTIGNASTESASGIVYLQSPSNSSTFTQLTFLLSGLVSGGVGISRAGGGTRKSAADVTGIRFLMSTGNISTGTIKMYGCCKPA